MSSRRKPAGRTESGTIPGDFAWGEAAPGADPRLVLLILAPGGIREFDLPRGETLVVGRSSSVAIVVDDRSVSRSHARLTPGPGGPILQDLGSRNGTFVNGLPVAADGSPIKIGDDIRFGNVSAQLLQLRAAAPVSARLVSPAEFDLRVTDEGDRCVGFNRSLSVVAIEAKADSERVIDLVRSTPMQNALSVECVTVRSAIRLDVLIPESAKQHAEDLAQRLHQGLAAQKIQARLGVAVFPGDSPSSTSLVPAAELAMRAVAGGVGLARAAVRMLQIGSREVIVADPAMVRLFALAERMARVPMAALIMGETGSGKEIIAEALHVLGPRAKKPLVKLNCAAVPETMLEAELFGYERGAFSGAVNTNPGLIERAEGGTLFLDEIAEMSPALQAKLLRVLEDHVVRRLGGPMDRQVDVRVVAATHRDLAREVEQGRFRQDLFYRLNTLVLTIPPLRERKQEIAFLAERFAAEAAIAAGQPAVSLSPRLLAALEAYRWPGNIRELRNIIGRAVVMGGGEELDLPHIPAEIAAEQGSGGRAGPGSRRRDQTGQMPVLALDEELREVERERILQALEACGGNQTRAAEMLKTPRRTLVSRLAALGISGPRSRRPHGGEDD